MIAGRAMVAVLAALLAVLAGCAPGMPIRATFDASEYAQFESAGIGSISGRALVLGVAGGVKPGALRTVYLDPATTYSTEWLEKMVRWSGKVRFRQLEPGFTEHRRETVTDVEGRFRFQHLPAGEYFITCDMWRSFGVVATGGFGYARITLGDGEQIDDASLAVVPR